MNFVRDLNEEINLLGHNFSNAEFLIMGDINCRTERQVKLLHFFNVSENCKAESCNFANTRSSKNKVVMQKKRSAQVV
jgi:hypothetical protein